MPKGKRGRKRRQRDRQHFVTLNAAGGKQADMSSIVQQVRRGHVALRETSGNELRKAQLNDSAVKNADDLTEIFIPKLPPATPTANSLVRTLLALLFQRGLVNLDFSRYALTDSIKHLNPPIIRCHVRTVQSGASASLIVRSKGLADSIVAMSPLRICGKFCRVVISSRAEHTGDIRSSRRQRDGLDCPTFSVGRMQLGHLATSTLFLSSWHSYDHFHTFGSSDQRTLMDAMDATLELNAVRRVLSIITSKTFQAYSSINLTDIERTITRLRIEIPFRSIYGQPYLQYFPEDTEHSIICIPVSVPPLIFRAQNVALFTETDPSFWDVSTCNAKQVNWVRTFDPSPMHAFSQTTAVRFIVDAANATSILKKFRAMGVALRKIPPPLVVLEQPVPQRPPMQKLFRSQKLHLSFSVRYMVACVMSLGVFDLHGFDNKFWKALYTGADEEQTLNNLQLMFIHGTGTAFHAAYDSDLINGLSDAENPDRLSLRNPLPIYLKCLEMCGTRLYEDESTHDGTGDGDDDNESMASDSDSHFSSDEEDFLVEETLRSLRVGNTSASGPHINMTAPLVSGTSLYTGGVTSRRSKKETMIRRVLVTPTRIIAQPPEPDLLNRVLRQFFTHKLRFIRVSFCDEDGSNIAHVGSDDLFTRVRLVLRDGLPLAGETFVFLAFSNSQMREHGAWFYNETPDPRSDLSVPPTAEEIRAWMGDFSNIRVPGKFASRQGQAFSSTVSTVDLADGNHLILPDIMDSSKKYMFSDGVGIMKTEVAIEMVKKLGLKKKNGIPSAFQIRFGGAKGMLTVWDEAFPSNVDPRVGVILRESMNKFHCKHKAIEVVGFSKRMPLYLNRQMIMLLSGHNVPDAAFKNLLEKFLHNLDCAMAADGKRHALRLLRNGGDNGVADGRGMKLFSCGSGTDMAPFFLAGLTCVNCEHLFNMMYAYRRNAIGDLIKRMRIPINPSKGLCAVGVLDELGVLGPREIFCQYMDASTGDLTIVTGLVTVGRSPCLHPGDIQPLMAVDRCELRHLVDVIVFPSVGARPLPSMLCGGDLDGDIYFCISDESLALPNRSTIKAMDYTAPQPREIDHPVTVSDVADFFVDYLKNDRVGVIANAHVGNGDKEQMGIFSEKCLQLAMYHSTAVDFPKTGVPVPRQHYATLPKTYPDFMCKHPKMSYRSSRILGMLYRSCMAHTSSHGESATYTFENNEESKEIDDFFEKIALKGGSEMLEDGKYMCEMYNAELSVLMQQYGVGDEGELVSGNVISFPEGLSRKKGGQTHFTLQMRLNRQLSDLRQTFREEFFIDIDKQDKERTALKAAVWYESCRRVAEADRKEKRGVLVSFPWVVPELLLSLIEINLKLS